MEPHAIDRFVVNEGLADLNNGGIAWARVFDGIRKQIHKHLLHQASVALYDAPLDIPVGDFAFHFAPDFLDMRTQAYVARAQFVTAHLRQFKKIVDQARHSGDRMFDSMQILLQLFIKMGSVFFQG